MKRINYLSLFATIALLTTLISCNYKQKLTPVVASLQVDTTKCSQCYTYNKVGVNAAELDYNLIKTMTLNYQYPSGVTSTSPNNTRSIWLSLNELKNFIYQIENKTCGCDANLGVRIYYGTYPGSPTNDATWTSTTAFNKDLGPLRSKVVAKFGNNAYAGINTILMIPTMEYNGKNYDFDPKTFNATCNVKDAVFSLKATYGQVDKGTANTFTTTAYGTSITALMAKNHGEACPPIPPGMLKCPDAVGAHFDY